MNFCCQRMSFLRTQKGHPLAAKIHPFALIFSPYSQDNDCAHELQDT